MEASQKLKKLPLGSTSNLSQEAGMEKFASCSFQQKTRIMPMPNHVMLPTKISNAQGEPGGEGVGTNPSAGKEAIGLFGADSDRTPPFVR